MEFDQRARASVRDRQPAESAVARSVRLLRVLTWRIAAMEATGAWAAGRLTTQSASVNGAVRRRGARRECLADAALGARVRRDGGGARGHDAGHEGLRHRRRGLIALCLAH